MESRDTGERLPASLDDDRFPNPPVPRRSNAPGPPSIISSRMTDIASDDGHETDQRPGPHASGSPIKATADSSSRPGSARTGLSSSRDTWRRPQSLRKSHMSGLALKRVSTGGGSIANIRPPSSTSRSHVPSLASHAFFNPLSSQKLQAQRGGPSRPQTSNTRQGHGDERLADSDGGTDGARHSIISNPMARMQRQMSDDGEMRPPASRGTEFTEQETLDRITANTSPTHGHTAAGSLSDSVRPLQRQNEARNLNLSIDVGRSYRNLGSMATPAKSPRSFRSSFLLPGRNGDGQSTPNRALPGAEKLSSAASSPRLNPEAGQRPADGSNLTSPRTNLGYVFQYFEGNTVFCLGGRFQNTKHRPINIATGFFLVLPGVLFFVFSGPWLWHNISPAIPITFAYLYYISLSSFVHASLSDPGVCAV